MLSDATVRDCLERLVPLQEASAETVNSLNGLKQEGRSDGLNIEAVNALLPILVRHPYDKGAAVLNDIIHYAEIYGAEGLVARRDGGAQASAGGQASAEVPQLPEATTPPPSGSGRRPVAFASARVSMQVVASLCVTFGLIWLLN